MMLASLLHVSTLLTMFNAHFPVVRRSLRLQFLTEAVVLCAFGGIVGLLLAFGASVLIAGLIDVPAVSVDAQRIDWQPTESEHVVQERRVRNQIFVAQHGPARGLA